jgi:hypothetical protein
MKMNELKSRKSAVFIGYPQNRTINPGQHRVTILFFIICLLCSMVCFTTHTTAQKVANPETHAKKGKLILKYDFKTPAEYTKEFQAVNDSWKVRVGHANWKQTKKGVESNWESGHMPVLVLNGEFCDAIIEVDFRYKDEENKWSACRISATNPELAPRSYAVSVWANVDSRSRKPGMVLENDEWKPGEITTVDTLMATFTSNKWHTLRLELVGNEARATCNGFTVFGTHEKFGIPKNSIYLGSGTSKHEFRRLRVYEAIPDPKR